MLPIKGYLRQKYFYFLPHTERYRILYDQSEICHSAFSPLYHVQCLNMGLILVLKGQPKRPVKIYSDFWATNADTPMNVRWFCSLIVRDGLDYCKAFRPLLYMLLWLTLGWMPRNDHLVILTISSNSDYRLQPLVPSVGAEHCLENLTWFPHWMRDLLSNH